MLSSVIAPRAAKTRRESSIRGSAGAVVELVDDDLQIGGGVHRRVGALRQVLTEQPVGVVNNLRFAPLQRHHGRLKVAVPCRLRWDVAARREKGITHMDRVWQVRYHLVGVSWDVLKADLRRDRFDNGRSPEQLRLSFERSHATALACSEERVVGTARLLSDGVCNAYLLDVWTQSTFRRRGVASAQVKALLDTVPGQHVALITGARADFYASLGFKRVDDTGMSLVVGSWLNRTPTDRACSSR